MAEAGAGTEWHSTVRLAGMAWLQPGAEVSAIVISWVQRLVLPRASSADQILEIAPVWPPHPLKSSTS